MSVLGKIPHHEIQVTVRDEDGEVVVTKSVSGNLDIGFLIQHATVDVLVALKRMGYGEPVPDSLPEC